MIINLHLQSGNLSWTAYNINLLTMSVSGMLFFLGDHLNVSIQKLVSLSCIFYYFILISDVLQFPVHQKGLSFSQFLNANLKNFWMVQPKSRPSATMTVTLEQALYTQDTRNYLVLEHLKQLTLAASRSHLQQILALDKLLMRWWQWSGCISERMWRAKRKL